MPPRVVMHLDLDYFYAQCEENANPTIRGKPVVVCVYSGRTVESGAVSTSNYLARKYGVKAGIPIVHARKLLESVDAAFLPMNRPYYEQVSARVMEILRAYGGAYEKMSIDEAFLDISERTHLSYDSARDTAREIKNQLFTEEHITCSVGVAPNKVVAKIASDQTKPDGLTVVKPEEVTGFLSPLPVGRSPGVGERAEERLTQLNVSTIAELSALNPTVLVEIFGKSLGSYLYRASRGENDEPVKEREQPTQFSRIATLKQNTRKLEEILPLIDELATSVAERLKTNGMTCKSVAIIAILTDLSMHSKSRTLESSTPDGSLIKSSLKQLIEELLQSLPDAVLRRVGVRVSDLMKPTGQTDISKFLTA
jgi:DNA polymerase IV (DinB-like DNA polymerase)